MELEPVPAVYVSFAFEPLSAKYQPSGTQLDVPLLASVSKFCVYATSGADSKIVPAARVGVIAVRFNNVKNNVNEMRTSVNRRNSTSLDVETDSTCNDSTNV